MADFPTGISVDEARRRVLDLAAAHRVAPERVALHEAAMRVLAEDVVAARDLPPFVNSAMDGFAVRGDDLPTAGERRLRIVGTRYAGDGQAAVLEAGECLRITTGAALPRGADTVVIKERVRVDGDELVVGEGQVAGANVRAAGEDYRAGEIALRAGQRLGAGRLGVLASLGHAEVQVAARPRVVVLTTGDELVAPGMPLGPAQIHNSNGYSIAAMVAEAGAANIDSMPPFRHVGDDRVALRDGLLAAAAVADVVVSSGGVSAGELDLLPDLLAGIGRIHFWKLRMRPGMPVLCGAIGRTLVFGLPGNPVSGIATFHALVRPVLRAMQGADDAAGERLHARLAAPIGKRHDRTEFVRARRESLADGSITVRAVARQGSGMLRGIVEADCLVVVPESMTDPAAGTLVEVLPLPAAY